MKISVIVPVYNVEPFVQECFDSIVAQTYDNREIECIFVDDCGSDGSMAIVEDAVAGYRGDISFTILHHDRNRGLSCARNTAMRQATGDYVYFLDSDDTITPDCLERLAAHVTRHPGVDIVQGSFESRFQFMSLGDKKLPEYSDNFKWIRITMLQRFTIPMTGCNRLVRLDMIREHGLYFEEGLRHEDEVWNFFLAKHVRSISIEKRDTYIYRENPNSIMGTCDHSHRYDGVLEIMLRNMSRPYIGSDIDCILSLTRCGNYDRFMRQIKGAPLHERFLAGSVKNTRYDLKGIYYKIGRRLVHLYMTIAN